MNKSRNYKKSLKWRRALRLKLHTLSKISRLTLLALVCALTSGLCFRTLRRALGAKRARRRSALPGT